MGTYHCGVTPEIEERNPFVGIATLVVALAIVAGLAARFGMNNAVAAVCAAIAVVGTWVLLAPQGETLEPAVSGAASNVATQRRSVPTSRTAPNSAFVAAPPEGTKRQGLRTAPRVAVGFDGVDAAEPDDAARPLPARDDDVFVEIAAPVQALGQLPQDAHALSIDANVNPPSNVSGAYTLGRFEVRAASRRGSDHVILNDPRQDDYVVAKAANGRYLVVVVADGETAAENAQFGSYWASRLLAQTIDLHLRDGIPGIDKMLERTRDELTKLFEKRFTDGTKMRTIATTLVGLIAPVDGGPAAGFRVGDSDILIDGPDGWSSVFGDPQANQAEVIFPRTVDADVAPLNFDVNCLLLATDGVSGPIATNDTVAMSYSAGLAAPISEVEFDQLMAFPLEQARGDRTAVAVWFAPAPSGR